MNHTKLSSEESQQTTLPMSPSTTMTAIKSSPSSTVDGPNPISALASPTERLERELHQARIFLEDVYLREETHVDQAKKEDDDDSNSFTRHLESADKLKNEMERAKHELMESSLRAEEYLADLSGVDSGIIETSALVGRPRGAGKDTKNRREGADDTSTANMDMKLLLADMADLKRELKNARDEISRLRRDACRIDVAKSEQYPKKHRRVISDPTTSTTIINSNSTIPTVVECLVQEKNSHTLALEDDYTEDEFEKLVYKACIANVRISNGFVDNNWLEGEGYADDDDGENECGGGACFLGGIADILKGCSRESRRKDGFG